MRRFGDLNPGNLLACRARLKKETHALKRHTHVQENAKLNPLTTPGLSALSHTGRTASLEQRQDSNTL